MTSALQSIDLKRVFFFIKWEHASVTKALISWYDCHSSWRRPSRPMVLWPSWDESPLSIVAGSHITDCRPQYSHTSAGAEDNHGIPSLQCNTFLPNYSLMSSILIPFTLLHLCGLNSWLLLCSKWWTPQLRQDRVTREKGPATELELGTYALPVLKGDWGWRISTGIDGSRGWNSTLERRSWVRARSLVLFPLSPYPVWAVEFTIYYS